MGKAGSSFPRFGALATRNFKRVRLGHAKTSNPKVFFMKGALGLGGGGAWLAENGAVDGLRRGDRVTPPQGS
jgi:hypothetical protein